MSYIRFNHVFSFLLLASALAAFAIPEEYTGRPLPGVQVVFAPVSYPVRKVGAWAHERLVRHDLADARSAQGVGDENVRLSAQVDFLQKQLDVERRRNADWERLGDLRDRCVPVPVAGADAGSRDSLALPASTLERVKDGAVALYPGGIAGQIQGRAGLGGAQLRLITDRGFRVRGHFVRRGAAGTSDATTPTLLLEGVGDGAMVVRAAVTWEEIEKYKRVLVGDAAVLDERDWPVDLHGQRLGVVTRVERMRAYPQFAEVRVEPSANLELLREVMVLTK